MPSYCFTCKCGQKIEVVRPMADANKPWKCFCGKPMARDFQTEHVFTGSKDYSKALVSDSLAVHPDQIPEHKKQFPNIDMTPEGQPIFTNYRQHQDYLDKTGFQKLPQKIR